MARLVLHFVQYASQPLLAYTVFHSPFTGKYIVHSASLTCQPLELEQGQGASDICRWQIGHTAQLVNMGGLG